MRRDAVARAILTLITLIFAAAPTSAFGQFSVLYNFGSVTGDGRNPAFSGTIAQGRDGNLYTTTPSGGSAGDGAVLQITPAGTATVLYSFKGTDGSQPSGGLTLGTDGNFYGTTAQGGAHGSGTIFNITSAGALTVLYSFTSRTDGSNPSAPPIQGTDGSWYGTTSLSGGNGVGTVYKFTSPSTFTALYAFDTTHGSEPSAPLIQGSDGNFYGTTVFGGTSSGGVVFKITPAGVLTVLYNFDTTHGRFPRSPLIQASDGNFYGTTQSGGTSASGVAFKITSAGVLSVLHNMNGSAEGGSPYAGLVQGSDGNLYGDNDTAGGSTAGTLFKMSISGVLTVQHNFDTTGGSAPQVTLFQHTNGILYGDTNLGGTGNVSPCATAKCGVFYEINDTLSAFITPMPYAGNVGSSIGILGQGFSNASVVKFNGVIATSITLTGTAYIQAKVPTGASSGLVTVTTGATTLKSLRKFIVHDSWASGKSIPTPLNYPAGTAAIGSKIYVVGGGTASGNIATNQIYNATSDSWSTGAPLPAATAGGSAAVVKGILYIFGGYSGTTSGTAVNAVWAYNPATNSWAGKAAMPTARGSTTAVVSGTKVYVIGGNGSTLRLNTVEAYDTAADSWTTEAPLLVGKSEPAGGLLGAKVVSADGTTTSGPSGDNEAYNTSTNTWSALAADSTARNAVCYGVVSGQLYVAGGHTTAGAVSLSESYNLTTNKWAAHRSLTQATIAPGSAVVGTQLYCISGSSSDLIGQGTLLPNVQIYQP
jgi:uncharacterized repeat protein (TIGR03803 family)